MFSMLLPPRHNPPAPARFTGWHMAAILTAFFGVVIAVNVFMAHLASSTFSGEVVENGYVASQQFNGWLATAARERALGWSARVVHRADGRITVAMAGPGTTADDAGLTAIAWRPLGEAGQHSLHFTRAGDGSFVSDTPLAHGRWQLRLTYTAGGHGWHHEAAL